MTRESVPVWRDRWKARSWLCRCWKVVLATRRMVFCVTCTTHVQQAASAGLMGYTALTCNACLVPATLTRSLRVRFGS